MIDLHDNQIEELGNYFQLKVGVDTITKPIYRVINMNFCKKENQAFYFPRRENLNNPS